MNKAKRIRIENWPPYFMNGEVPELRVGNPGASVAVCTLWTPVDFVWKGLNSKTVAVAGQLKTPSAGVDGIIRTCAANRAVRTLILCGKEMKEGVGSQALLSLIKNGVDNQRRTTIPLAEIEKFRQQIEVVDLRDVVDSKKIQKTIDSIEYRPPFKARAVLLPLPRVETEIFPRGIGAELIVASSIGEAYVLVLERILKFGSRAMTNYGEEAADALNVVTVTDELIKDETSWRILPFTHFQIEDYIQRNFLTPKLSPGEWYTYGERLFAFGKRKINQFEIIVAKLLKDANDRGAIAILYNPEKDKEKQRNPCLYSLQASIGQNKLLLTSVFRSNDMMNAWPWNAFGLRKIQEMIFRRVKSAYSDLTIGSLVTISTRAHIYQSAYETAQYLVKKHRKKVREVWDQRGNLAIKVEGKKIVVVHYSPDGRFLQEFKVDGCQPRAADKVAEELLRRQVISQVSHALYLGQQLARAEEAIKLGLKFEQDKELMRR